MRIMTNKDATAPYVREKNDVSKYIITMELADKVKVIDTKSGDFVIEKQDVEVSRVKTQDYIDSFKDDVGIENILKKFALSNDPELLNQRTRPSVPVGDDGKEAVQDYTGVPSNQEEALNIAAKAKAAYKALPAELVNNRSFMEFAETCTEEELQAYIATLKTASDKKEGE